MATSEYSGLMLDYYLVCSLITHKISLFKKKGGTNELSSKITET
jgi:hypothetical protein